MGRQLLERESRSARAQAGRCPAYQCVDVECEQPRQGTSTQTCLEGCTTLAAFHLACEREASRLSCDRALGKVSMKMASVHGQGNHL